MNARMSTVLHVPPLQSGLLTSTVGGPGGDDGLVGEEQAATASERIAKDNLIGRDILNAPASCRTGTVRARRGAAALGEAASSSPSPYQDRNGRDRTRLPEETLSDVISLQLPTDDAARVTYSEDSKSAEMRPP